MNYVPAMKLFDLPTPPVTPKSKKRNSSSSSSGKQKKNDSPVSLDKWFLRTPSSPFNGRHKDRLQTVIQQSGFNKMLAISEKPNCDTKESPYLGSPQEVPERNRPHLALPFSPPSPRVSPRQSPHVAAPPRYPNSHQHHHYQRYQHQHQHQHPHHQRQHYKNQLYQNQPHIDRLPDIPADSYIGVIEQADRVMITSSPIREVFYVNGEPVLS